MKKFVIAAAFAATVMSTGAQAFGASSADACGHIDNPSRFNPVELSEYQECWLDFHKPDEATGMLGNLFWVRAGDGFVSMPVSELREAGSKKAAKAVVVEAVVERVVETRIVERIEEIYTGRDQLIAELGTGEGDVAAALEEIRSLQAEAMDLEEVMAAITAHGYVTYANGVISVDHADAIAAALRTGKDAASVRFAVGTIGFTTGQQYAGFISGNSDTYADLTGAASNSLSSTHDDGFVKNVRIRGFDDGEQDYIVNLHNGLNWIAVATIEADIVGLVDRVYDEGFDAGYDEGYADGYTDGFADGVASVN